jgi:adenylate cyclase
MFAEVMLQPGRTEYEVAVSASAAAREFAPRVRATLSLAFDGHLRELIRSDVISAADIAAGRTPGARDIAVCFADLVGFTRMGEQVPAEELGEVVRRLEELASGLVERPVTFVKTIGDAVMLVAPDVDPLLEAAVRLIERADDQNLRLRVGVAYGAALERAGDWYGSPVNQASRVTAAARPGSVLTTQRVRDQAGGDWSWSRAGERKLKGVGTVKLFRARRPEPASPRSGSPR